MSITRILPVEDAFHDAVGEQPRRIIIKNACFDCSIGVYPEEVNKPQPVR